MTRKAVAWFSFWAGVLFGAPPNSRGSTVGASMLAFSLLVLVLVIIWRSAATDGPKPPRRLKR